MDYETAAPKGRRSFLYLRVWLGYDLCYNGLMFH